MMKVKVVVVRNKKCKPEPKTDNVSDFSLQVISPPTEINSASLGNLKKENLESTINKVVSNEPMDINNVKPELEAKIALPEATKKTKTKKVAKPKAKSKKQLAAELKKTIETKVVIKQELGVINQISNSAKEEPQNKVQGSVFVKSEPVDSVLIQPLEVMIKTESQTMETELPVVEVKTEPEPESIKSELPDIAIKKENVIDLVDEDDDLPELFTQAPTLKIIPNTTVSISNGQESADEKLFNEAVEHYNRPEVQCAIFFPLLTPKRRAVRGDKCSAEYASSGRSHCRVCLGPIKKEELRFGLPFRDTNFGSDRYGHGRLIDHWHHARCFWGTYKLKSAYNIDGWTYLADSDQRLILECVRQLK